MFLCSSLYPYHKGYSFITYGENIIILLENLFIFFMAWSYDINQSSDRQNMTFTLLICSFLFVIYKEFLDEKAWTIIGSASTVLSVGSRITQIIKSCKEKSTGPLSTITFALNMLGNVARIFTTMKENQDLIMAGGFIVSFILNLIIFLQIIYYNRPRKIEKTDEVKKEEKPKAQETKEKDNKKSKKKKKE